MPQLNPRPWFYLLLVTWTLLLTLMLPAILKNQCPQLPNTKPLHKTHEIKKNTQKWH